MPVIRPAISVVAALFAFAAVPVHAQAPLTFDDAVRQALERSPAIKEMRAREDRAAAEASAARGGWFPRVSFVEAAQRGNQPVFVFSSLLSARRFGSANFAVDALNHPADLSVYRRAVGVEQLLFDGGRTQAAVRSAHLARDMADLSVRQTAADLVVLVAEQYGRVLAAEARARAAGAATTAALEDLARAEQRRDAGRATEAEVLAMSAHLADVRQRAIQAAGDAAVARAHVNSALGAPIVSSLVTVEPSIPPVAAADLASLLRTAEGARPEVARALAGEAAAFQTASAARADWWPRVVGRAAYESNGIAYKDRASGWIAGVELQWSLSLGGAELARTRAAAAGLAEARAVVEQAKSAAGADLVAARERQYSARARLEVGRAAVQQARESERIIRDRYGAGLSAMGDVLRASSLVLDAESARVDAVVDALVADAQFDRAIGRDPWLNR